MIEIEDGEFIAPAGVAYAGELQKAGWRLRGDRWVTKQIEIVAPFIDHLAPNILEKLAVTAEKIEKSRSHEPSEGFVAIVPAGQKLEPFQEASVEYILEHKDTLLAQECGTGKTAMMIVALNMMMARRVLIICPAVAKYNWALKEWPKWNTQQDLTVGVVEANDWTDTDVVIINFDILERHKVRANAHLWDCLIIDEAHKAKNPDAKRTILIVGGAMKIRKERQKGQALPTNDEVAVEDQRVHAAAAALCARPLSKNTWFDIPPIPARKRVFATATPMNRPKDLWNYCKVMDPDGLGRDHHEFLKRYCAAYQLPNGRWYDNGADHEEELGARLREKFMIRHQESVLKLPPHSSEIFLLPPVKLEETENETFVRENMDALLEMSERMGEPLPTDPKVQDFLRVVGKAILDNVSLIGEPEFQPMFQKFAEIREKTGLAKVPHVCDYIDLKTDNGVDPLVVFGYHRSVLRELHKHYPNSGMIIGGLSAKKRFEIVNAFQNGEINPLFRELGCGWRKC